MHFKRFRCESVRDGLRIVRRELGPDALILSTSLVPAAGWRGLIGRREVEIVAAAERSVSEPRRTATAGRPAPPDPAIADLSARLVAAGFEPQVATEIAAIVPRNRRRGSTPASLRGVLADWLSGMASPDESYAPIEVFVGPPGAGKTTTIAKIASQARARRGQRLGLIATDTLRAGAVEQLRVYADVLRSPLHVVRDASDLRRALSDRRRTPVLVDTAGRNPNDAAVAELFDVLGTKADVRTHLVMPAGTPPRMAKRIFDAYAPARPSRLVLTKLDEAESMAPLVGLLRERRLPISYLGTGQRVPEDLSRATAANLAASVLGDPPAHQVNPA